jgi:hypothetical protein
MGSEPAKAKDNERALQTLNAYLNDICDGVSSLKGSQSGFAGRSSSGGAKVQRVSFHMHTPIGTRHHIETVTMTLSGRDATHVVR